MYDEMFYCYIPLDLFLSLLSERDWSLARDLVTLVVDIVERFNFCSCTFSYSILPTTAMESLCVVYAAYQLRFAGSTAANDCDRELFDAKRPLIAP